MTLSPELILEFHRRMLALTPERGGQWKSKDNAIIEVKADGRQAIRFRPVSAVGTPEFMEKLCRLYREALDEQKVEPLLLIPSFILDFECIHPFMDGNGRIGRLLALLLLYQSGYEVGRYVSLERIVEDTKETYYADLQDMCPAISYPTLQRGLAELKKNGAIRCLGRGPDAEWERIRS